MTDHGAHILVEDVTHRYRAKAAPVLVDVRFEIQPGQALAIIGRSGCGKSTLLHIIAGLMKPAQGGIYVDGARVHGPSPKWIMMFQQPSLYPWMTVGQNVALGMKFAGVSYAKAQPRVRELLSLVHLDDYLDTNVQDLSGGQQQRVALARSLCTSPEILLLDEPFSALDAFTRAALRRDVRAIAKELGITLVLVTHDIDEAVVMADRALVMDANPGRVRCDTLIDLPDPRSPADPAVQAERERLMGLFEETAGVSLSGGADLDAAPVPDTPDVAPPRVASLS